MRRLRHLTLLAAVFVGCATHVQLEPVPDRSESFKTRALAYQRVAPRAAARTVIIHAGVSVNVATDYIEISGGRQITEPEDLLVVLPAESRAALAIRDYVDQSALSDGLLGGAISAFALAVGVGMPVLLATGETDAAGIPQGNLEAGLPILTGLTAVGIGLTVGSLIVRSDVRRLRNEAFFHYEESLREGLGLCVDGKRLIECKHHDP